MRNTVWNTLYSVLRPKNTTGIQNNTVFFLCHVAGCTEEYISSKNTTKEYTRNIYSYCIFGGISCALSEYNRIHYILKCISVVGYILLSCLERHFGIQQEYSRNTQEYSVLSVKHNIYSIIQGP